MTRLQELGFTDFTGGLRIHEDRAFQLADNESPQMLNMRADSRLGIYTRRGWRRWNETPATTGTWNPRFGYEHDFSNDTNAIFVTNEERILVAENSTTFVELEYTANNSVGCNAFPHLADFASWGDSVYIATGRKIDDLGVGDTPIRYDQGGAVVSLDVLGVGTYNDDYTTPVGGVMPQADLTEPHAGYLFCASVRENEGSGVRDLPSRLRWSHPDSPEDWAQLDFLDIEVGGGRITGLLSFQDHLLIFKTDSIWALYGYDSESWQLIKVSPRIGIPSPTAMARSPIGAFFYSISGGGDIYVYDGQGVPTRISENIETPIEEIPQNRYIDVWMGWASDRLLVSIPWIAEWDPAGGVNTVDNSLFAFDPYVGEGGWEMHRPALGNVGPIIERSDSLAELSLVVLYGSAVDACLVQISAIDGAYDLITDTVTPEPFGTRYATNWKFAGTPELRKHWLRPRYVVRNPLESVEILVEVYRDYDESEPRRAHVLFITADGSYFWRDLGFDDPAGDGFDWEPTDPAGRGGVWTGATRGGRIIRGKSFGIARSVQVVFSTAPATSGQEWGIDAVVLKHIDRRFTT